MTIRKYKGSQSFRDLQTKSKNYAEISCKGKTKGRQREGKGMQTWHWKHACFNISLLFVRLYLHGQFFSVLLKIRHKFLCDLDRFAWFFGHAPTEGVLLRADVLMSHRRINQFKSVPTGRIGPVFESIVCCVNQLYVVQASCVLCRAVAYCANLHPRIVGIWFKSRFFTLL